MKKLGVSLLLNFGLLLSSIVSANDEDILKAKCRSFYGFTAYCTACHVPPTGTLMGNGMKMEDNVVYLYVESMSFRNLQQNIRSLSKYKYNKIVMELFSFGGSLFDAMAMIGILQEERDKGIVIEINGKGIIASAGLLILLSGTPGHRSLEENAMIMWHELATFKFFAVETPSDKEAEAIIYRKIQNKVNDYIVKNSKITLEELNIKIKKRELWLDAKEAIAYGFADHITK